MKNFPSELEDLMAVAKVNNMRKDKIRRDFAQMDNYQKKRFVEEFQFGIIRTTKNIKKC